MFIRSFIAGLALSIGCMASAATLDFTDPAFASTFPSPGTQSTADVTVDGVNFTVTATARGSDGFRQTANGLSFGLPGNGMSSISIVADAAVDFVSFIARDAYPTLDGAPSYQVSIDGVLVSQDNNTIGGTLQSFNFANGPLRLDAGSTFLFEPEFFGILIGGNVASFDFTRVTTPPTSSVPLPAGLPLLLVGMGAFGWLRRKQTA